MSRQEGVEEGREYARGEDCCVRDIVRGVVRGIVQDRWRVFDFDASDVLACWVESGSSRVVAEDIVIYMLFCQLPSL